jgi:ADP-heptose:LPS heptosyltransferase
MREIDVRVGCFIFTAINLLFIFRSDKKIKPIPKEKVKKILVIKFFGMGTILLMSPMLKGVRSLYPDAQISLLTFKGNFEFSKLVHEIDRVLSVDDKNIFLFFKDTFRYLLLMWKERPSIIIDVEFFSNFTSLFSLFTFAPVRIGYHLRQVSRGHHLTHKVFLNTHHHVTYTMFHLAAALGAKYDGINFSELFLKEPNLEQIKSAYLKLAFNEDSSIILINPNASELLHLRRWPSGYFVSLISKMLQKYPEHKYVLVGSESEFEYVQSIADQVKSSKIINSAGMLTIGEFCALLYQANLVVTNDSLPVHIASAYKINVVTFFGPETPSFYGPLNSNSLSFFENIPCSPCLIAFDNKAQHNCTNNICLKKIDPERVFLEVEKKFLSQSFSLVG